MTHDEDRRETASWLCSAAATEVLAAARAAIDATPNDPLTAGTSLRARFPDVTPALLAAALEQATLARLAADRGMPTDGRLLTRDGLEAGTRPEVAARRALLLRAAGAARVLDLTGGLGFDAGAFTAAGLAVTAIERDPVIARYLAHNLPSVEVIAAEATEVLPRLLATLSPTDVVFADPARRDPDGPRDRATGRARPERDPERWSPPWSVVAGIAHPRVAAKVAPGFAPPATWEAEWTSVDRTVVECALYSWPLSGVARRAVVLSRNGVTVVDADADAEAVAATDVAAWVHEPDPAVLRAGAAATLARTEGLASVSTDSTWLTGARPSASPALRSFLVIEELNGSTRQQRRRLAELGVTRATVKSRDVDVDPREARRSLGIGEGPERVIVMTRRGGRVVSLLTQPAAARSR